MKSTLQNPITADDLYNTQRNPLSIQQFREKPIPANYLTLKGTVLAYAGSSETLAKMEIDALFEEQKDKISEYNEVAYFWGRWLFW